MKGYWNSPIVRRLLSKRGLTGFFCLLAGVGVLGWLLVPEEPSYQGRKLTEYQAQMFDLFHQNGSMDHLYRMGVEAGKPFLQPMGTNALPFLLKQIQSKDSRLEIWLRSGHSQRGWEMSFPFKPEWYDRQCAVLSFGALKEHAYPAVPELLRLAKQEEDLRPDIVDALTLMERSDQELLDIMVEMIRNGSDAERGALEFFLLRMGDKARPAVPEIKRILANERSLGKTNAFFEKLIERIGR